MIPPFCIGDKRYFLDILREAVLMDQVLEEVVEALRKVKELEPDLSSGRLFIHSYETGNDELRAIALEAYKLFYNSNALNPLVFRSALYFEREVVGFSRELMSGGEDVVGTLTYGGTESIVLAALAAREAFRRAKGSSVVPEIVAPVTAHPAIRKAAWLLGMKVVETPVDPSTKKADVEAVKEALGPNAALVYVSAPNYPFGTIDPVRAVAEAASDKGVPVHVDACIGGFILPFMERLGYTLEPFDFRVDGVTSISLDVHKYGYSPKGASVVLFRNPEMKKRTIFVDVAWPGYPFINTTILSSRSVAPMAAAWATIKYLGFEGYLDMARKVVDALREITESLRKLGFKLSGPLESPVISLYLDEDERIIEFHANMSLKGWIIGLQPRVKGLASYNVHLTISPIHRRVAKTFIEDARKSLEEGAPRELKEVYEIVFKDPLKAAKGVVEARLASIVIALLLSMIPPGEAAEMAKELVVEVSRR